MRLLISIIANALGFWLMTLVLSGGISVIPFDPSPAGTIGTYLALAVIWGVVNWLIGGLIRRLGFCLYVVTVGLISLVVNGFLLWLVALASEQLGWGLRLEGFGWAVLGALVLAIVSAIVGGILRGLLPSGGRERQGRERR